jgi:8-oxo-dGTP pyrophosphatase MutT (NUDIX family)
MASSAEKKRGNWVDQAAALPWKIADGRLMTLLVTSRDTGRWIIPKGWLEPNLAPHQLAEKEAFEEAGLIGKSSTQALASFKYAKRISSTVQKLCRVEVYLFEVELELPDWPEKHQRRRQWVTPDEAACRVAERGLQKLFTKLHLAASLRLDSVPKLEI